MSLDEYRRKRDFTATPEPSGEAVRQLGASGATRWQQLAEGHRFCIQRHRARRLHWDLRLEHDGVLLSWAVPRGPSLDPKLKRMAVRTEDHPLDYGAYEGVIPSGYGMGTVELWDMGTFEWVGSSAGDPVAALLAGDLRFVLAGLRLAGEFVLIRPRPRVGEPDGDERSWLLIKKRDATAEASYDAADHDSSVVSGRSMDQIAAAEGGDPRLAARRAASRR